MSEPKKFRAAIVGAGPSGIGVAVGLARRGVRPVLLIERDRDAGGLPARYAAKPGGVPTFVVWTRARVVFGEQFASRLRRKLERTDVELWTESQVIAASRQGNRLTVVSPGRGKVHLSADAVVLACGARESTPTERGWIAGHRPARVYFTMQLLDLIDRHERLPCRAPAVLGSDLIAYSAAAKLKAAGADDAVLIDNRIGPATSLPERLYFRRWGRYPFEGSATSAEIQGHLAAQGVGVAGDKLQPCDGIVIAGALVPNSELAVGAGLDVELPRRRPVLGSGHRLSQPGWFATGNILGGFHGAQWCYFNGLRVARSVVEYLVKE